MPHLSEQNRHWFFWTVGALMTIFIGIIGTLGTSLQKQIDTNTSNIWEVRSTAVTEDKLDRQMSQVKEYIDIKFQSIEVSQRETTRQLAILISDLKSSQNNTREELTAIREVLSEKADRD